MFEQLRRKFEGAGFSFVGYKGTVTLSDGNTYPIVGNRVNSFVIEESYHYSYHTRFGKMIKVSDLLYVGYEDGVVTKRMPMPKHLEDEMLKWIRSLGDDTPHVRSKELLEWQQNTQGMHVADWRRVVSVQE